MGKISGVYLKNLLKQHSNMCLLARAQTLHRPLLQCGRSEHLIYVITDMQVSGYRYLEYVLTMFFYLFF